MLKIILIVDDSSLSRKLVRRCLSFSGLEAEQVLEAEDGKQALALVEQHPIDLLVTDITMPDMDGVELLRAIYDMPSAQVRHKVVVSSVATERWREDLVEYGVLDVISKPVNPQAFSPVASTVKSVEG